jgi:hypothetical protein
MKRSFADCMGFNWPAEIAYKIDGRTVTYADMKADRIVKQKEHLQKILAIGGPVRRAAYVWTFFNPHFPYSGWHLYLRTIEDSWWIRTCDSLAINIMQMFPCGLLPIPDNFYAWKEAFAKDHARPSSRRTKQGMVFGWVDVERRRRPFVVHYAQAKRRGGCMPRPS